jgi:AcrR family transcriptional regulator
MFSGLVAAAYCSLPGSRTVSERVEYSQPVLYSHFAGKAGIVGTVALEGFGELAAELRRARTAAPSADAALHAVAAAYQRFAESRPAVYDAMFVMPIDIPFAVAETPAAPRERSVN